MRFLDTFQNWNIMKELKPGSKLEESLFKKSGVSSYRGSCLERLLLKLNRAPRRGSQAVKLSHYPCSAVGRGRLRLRSPRPWAVQSAVPPAPARLPLSAVESNEMDVFRYGASAAAMGALGIGTPRGFVQGVFPGRGRGRTGREEGQRRFESR